MGVVIVIIILFIIITSVIYREKEKNKYHPTYSIKPTVTTDPMSETKTQAPPITSSLQTKNTLPHDFILTDEFKEAFDTIENTTQCAFITGKAGTGKSTLITYFREKTKKNVVYLAPTGIAAINIQGKTIHSFFKFPLHLIQEDDVKINFRQKDLFNKLDTIVIDEISMARADIIDGMDFSLRLNRRISRPFGGVQMIFIGDLYQLPPVVNSKEVFNITQAGNTVATMPLKEYFEREYGGFYFFNSKIFKSVKFETIELQHIFRQKDRQFIDLLNAFREQSFTTADLEILNRQCNPLDENNSNEVRLTICTTNAIANAMNEKRMNSLAAKPYIYEAQIEGRYDTELFPTGRNLILKTGSQVMMIKNDSENSSFPRWVNGSLGVVKSLTEDGIAVMIRGRTHTVKRETWEAIEYEYDQETQAIQAKVIGTFIQYPIKAAWAVTIHKSQGQTFDRVAIDLGNGAFAHGQTYVALSRCTSLEGITLLRPVRYNDIILDPKVVSFMKEIRPDIIF
jgi:ATP-dependent exoDNAse (exonuclease V) alpha subunit